jgi:hypothetical protein
MPEVTYGAIRDLVVSTTRDGDHLVCVFRCPKTEQTYSASALVGEAQVEARAEARSGLFTSLGWAALNAVRAVLNDPPDVPSDTTPRDPDQLEDDERAAAERAFQALSPGFLWDSSGERWVSAASVDELQTAFALQLRDHPVIERDDRALLVRLLVEVAKADGHLDQQEWEFLAKYRQQDVGSVDDFMRMPPLTAEDLRRAPAGPLRETMLLMAWTLSLVDEELASDETSQLDAFAEKLEVPPERNRELMAGAQEFIYDQALNRAYPHNTLDPAAHAEVTATGKALKLSPATAREIEQRYRKRSGIEPW